MAEYMVCKPGTPYARSFGQFSELQKHALQKVLPFTATIKLHTLNGVLGDLPVKVKLPWKRTNSIVKVQIQCDRACLSYESLPHCHISAPKEPVHPGTYANFVNHLLDKRSEMSKSLELDPRFDVWVVLVSEIEALMAVKVENVFRLVVVSPQDVPTLLNYGLEFEEAAYEFGTKGAVSKLEYFRVFCIQKNTRARIPIQNVLFPEIPKDQLLHVDGYLNNFCKANVGKIHDDWFKPGRFPFLKNFEYKARQVRFPVGWWCCLNYRQPSIDERLRALLERESERIQTHMEE